MEDLIAFFKLLPNMTKQFSVTAGVLHASFQQKNYMMVYQILHSFFTMREPAYLGWLHENIGKSVAVRTVAGGVAVDRLGADLPGQTCEADRSVHAGRFPRRRGTHPLTTAFDCDGAAVHHR